MYRLKYEKSFSEGLKKKTDILLSKIWGTFITSEFLILNIKYKFFERFNIISISLNSSLPSFNNIHSNNPHSIQTQDHLNTQQQDDDVDSSLYNFQGQLLFIYSLPTTW